MATREDVCKYLRDQACGHLTPLVLKVEAGHALIRDDPAKFLRVSIAKYTVARCPGIQSVSIVPREEA